MIHHWHELTVRVGLPAERADLTDGERATLVWHLSDLLVAGKGVVPIAEAHLVATGEQEEQTSAVQHLLNIMQDVSVDHARRFDPTRDISTYDQQLAFLRDKFPEKSPEWRDAYMRRALWSVEHNGDMTGAPGLPEG